MRSAGSKGIIMVGAGVALCAALNGPATAQDQSAARPKAFAHASGAAGDTSTGLAGSGIIVTAETGKSAVSLTLSQTFDSEARFDTWTLKASTPLDEDAGEGNFVSDDTLTRGSSFELGWTGVFTTARGEPPATSERRRAWLVARREKCVTDLGGAPSDAAVAACRDKSFADFDSSLTEAERAEFLDPFTSAPLVLAGLTATVGYDEVKFRTLTAIGEKVSETRVPWSVTAKLGFLPNTSPLYLGGGVEFERSYEDATTRTLCNTPTGSDPQECFTSPFGEPVKTDSATVFGAVRTRFSASLPRRPDLPIGLEIKPAYDFEHDVTGVSASLYLLPDKDGSLTGGLRLKAQTDDNDPTTDDRNFSVGVFIGTAFSLF